MAAHNRRKLVEKGLSSRSCCKSKPTYAMGGPGMSGKILPAIATIARITPMMIHVHSIIKDNKTAMMCFNRCYENGTVKRAWQEEMPFAEQLVQSSALNPYFCL